MLFARELHPVTVTASPYMEQVAGGIREPPWNISQYARIYKAKIAILTSLRLKEEVLGEDICINGVKPGFKNHIYHCSNCENRYIKCTLILHYLVIVILY